MKIEKWIVFPESRYVNSNPDESKAIQHSFKFKTKKIE